MGQHRIAIRLACALLVGGLIWPGAPASAAEVSADQIIRALTAAPKTRGLSAREAPVQSEAERGFVESLRHRTRSLSLGERERVLPIVEKQASIDVEIHFDYDSAAITDQAESQLASLARALGNSELKGALVLLGGRADAHGSDNYNQVLSERRAEAVSEATILVVKRSTLVTLANRDCDVARQLWTFTARELQRVRDHMLLLTRTAQERVASFLLDMARRLANVETLDIPMSRQDIADYLGLTIETISRTMTQFETQAAIALPTSRRIILRNRKALSRLHS